jgi:hypothetical protein
MKVAQADTHLVVGQEDLVACSPLLVVFGCSCVQ